ncbi:MAG: tetraacyldisaccharide 4'-kinase [Candidatus Methylomirabilales bacterium]
MNPLVYRHYRRWIAGHGPWGPPVRGLLRIASWIYGLGVVVRVSVYRTGLLRQERLAARIISIGNLTAGGTGKTPFVILLVQEVRKRGLRPAVVVRGYGGRREGRTVVVSGGDTIRLGYPEVGDEALLLARKLPGVPILMAADRVEGCQVAIREFGARVIILDDGFQHLRVERDLDILLLDQENPLGYGFLLPRGLLREPVRALQRADLLVMTGTGDPGEPSESPRLVRHAGSTPVLQVAFTPTVLTNTKTGETVDEEHLRREEVVAFSGIANPPAFERTLQSLGIFPKHHLIFPDHHPYGPSDLLEIAQRMEEVGAKIALTTEKDAVRLEKVSPPFSVVTIGVKLVLTGGQAEFKQCLDALFP